MGSSANPTGFLGGPTAPYIQPTPILPWLPIPRPIVVPPPAVFALTVTPAGMAFPSKDLLRLLDLYPDCPIALVPPTRYGKGRKHWHLDTRPTAPYCLKWSPTISPRINRVALQYAYPAVTENTTLYLLTPYPEHAGYYPLTPHAYLAHREGVPVPPQRAPTPTQPVPTSTIHETMYDCWQCGKAFKPIRKSQFLCSQQCNGLHRANGISLEQAKDAYRSGLTLSEVGEIFNVCEETIRKLFKRNSYPLR